VCVRVSTGRVLTSTSGLQRARAAADAPVCSLCTPLRVRMQTPTQMLIHWRVRSQAQSTGVKRFIELSTSQIYSGDKKASDETSKVDPWTTLAEYKLKAEQGLAGIAGLNYVIVRPAIVYGVSDVLGITPRLIVGAVYKQLGEKMKMLWSESLRLNTVHGALLERECSKLPADACAPVEDVAQALWFLRDKGANGEVFNLADKSDTSVFVDGGMGCLATRRVGRC
jgi:nucleoside-diphosphate-sugar epimerase